MSRSLERNSQRKTQIFHRRRNNSTPRILTKPSTSPTSPAETISNLDKINLQPQHRFKKKKITRYEVVHNYPPKSLLSTVTNIILLDASITITNNKGNNESASLHPCELIKKPDEKPLTRMENRTVAMQFSIQPHHLSSKLHLFNNITETLN